MIYRRSRKHSSHEIEVLALAEVWGYSYAAKS